MPAARSSARFALSVPSYPTSSFFIISLLGLLAASPARGEAESGQPRNALAELPQRARRSTPMPARATGRTVIGMGAAEDAVTLYLVVLAVVFAVNLLPAFAPPTWAVLVWFAVSYHPQPAALVVLGALAAAGGRLVLALGARRARGRLSPERTARLGAASDALARSRGGAATALGLFFLSPLPSGQLFVAAGLLAVRLRPLLLAFLAGRLSTATAST